MTRREFLALTTGTACLKAQSSGDHVGAARDLVYQALELLSATASPTDVKRAIGFLKNSLDQDANFGDAYYYRQLCLKRLESDPPRQKLDLSAAERYESEALRDKRDPFVLAVPKIYENLGAVGQKWALVVGISEFQPETGAERLSFAANDANSFAELLLDPKVGRFPQKQVFLLTNEKATTAAIKARMNTIATRAKPEDMVVVYVSTHGSSRSDDIRRVSYLYTHDTDVSGRDQIFGTALPMVEVSGILNNRCVAQRTMVIFDTCHSGASIAGQALSVEDINRLREGAGRYILSSCEEKQLSYEDAGHGYFTASLIARLRERQGCIRMGDLYRQVRKDVSDKVHERHQKKQIPVMAASENSVELVLGTPAGGQSEACFSA